MPSTFSNAMRQMQRMYPLPSFTAPHSPRKMSSASPSLPSRPRLRDLLAYVLGCAQGPRSSKASLQIAGNCTPTQARIPALALDVCSHHLNAEGMWTPPLENGRDEGARPEFRTLLPRIESFHAILLEEAAKKATKKKTEKIAKV